MESLQKEKLTTLYNEGKSMYEMSKILSCSVHKVVYWMDKYNIKRRTRSQATYIKQNPLGDPFKIKQDFTYNDMFLYGLGIGIYWGEGNKSTPHAIRVANTDPQILKIFIRFLLEICQLKKEKIKYSIVCFNDSNINEVKDYWSKQLKILPNKFGKIVQIPPQGKGIYKKKSKFGVCTVTACNIKLKSWIMKHARNDVPG